MSDFKKYRVRCSDRDCKAVFEVEAASTPNVQQTNWTQCPKCYEELLFPEKGNWSIRNDTRVVIGTW